jgi:hypothetical protein
MSILDDLGDVGSDIVDAGSDVVDAITDPVEDVAEDVGEYLVEKIKKAVEDFVTDGGTQSDGPDTEQSDTTTTDTTADELALADAIDDAFGTVDDIITVPDALTAALANAVTAAENPDDWSTEWSYVLDAVGPLDEVDFSADAIPVDPIVEDYALPVAEAETSMWQPADPIAYAIPVTDASTSFWSGALLH